MNSCGVTLIPLVDKRKDIKHMGKNNRQHCNYGVIIVTESVNNTPLYWTGETWKSDIIDAKIYLTAGTLQTAVKKVECNFRFHGYISSITYQMVAVYKKQTLGGLAQAKKILADRAVEGGIV